MQKRLLSICLRNTFTTPTVGVTSFSAAISSIRLQDASGFAVNRQHSSPCTAVCATSRSALNSSSLAIRGTQALFHVAEAWSTLSLGINTGKGYDTKSACIQRITYERDFCNSAIFWFCLTGIPWSLNLKQATLALAFEPLIRSFQYFA